MNVATKEDPTVIARLKSQSEIARELLQQEKEWVRSPIMKELNRRVAEARGKMNLQQGAGSRGR